MKPFSRCIVHRRSPCPPRDAGSNEGRAGLVSLVTCVPSACIDHTSFVSSENTIRPRTEPTSMAITTGAGMLGEVAGDERPASGVDGVVPSLGPPPEHAESPFRAVAPILSRTPMPGPRARCCLPPIMWLGNGDRDAISSRRIRGGDPPARASRVPAGSVRLVLRLCPRSDL